MKDQFVCQLSALGTLKQGQYDKQYPPSLQTCHQDSAHNQYRKNY